MHSWNTPHTPTGLRRRHARWGAVLAAALAGCLGTGGERLDTAQAAQSSFVPIGNIGQNGMLVSFAEITGVSGLDPANIVGLTACDASALYAVELDPVFFVRQLWFSNDGGQSWRKLSTPARGSEIACDHARLASLDIDHTLWVAPLTSDGNVGAWEKAPTDLKVDRIQGGDGTIYGVKAAASGKDVYVASAHSIDAPLRWGNPIANIGAVQVTGTGQLTTGVDDMLVGNTLAWPRRAFALEASGTVSFNSQLLDGQNLWTALDTGTERYQTLTAASPNLLYATQKRNGVTRLNRIVIEEASCFDGIDNDGNGLTDSEDPVCIQAVANLFCTTHADGNYCAARFEPSSFLGQVNQNAALVHCTSGGATSIRPGVCAPGAGSGNDFLVSLDALTPGDPPNTGHYCNMHWPDGSWDFEWRGATPCQTLINRKPGGKPVRAGLYSTTDANAAMVVCTNGGIGPVGAPGAAPLEALYNGVGHTNNSCIFSISMTALPLFDQMFDPGPVKLGPTLPFTHNTAPVALEPFGNGETGIAKGIDRFGLNVGDQRELAYDHAIDEGRPVFAVAGGVVLDNGSRLRDVTGAACSGTPNQGELYIKYSIGSDPTYRESFVLYYAHVRRRLVSAGQTVKPGQIVGYVGATGCATSGVAHLHSGVYRISNVNAHDPTNLQVGYHVVFQANDDGTGNNMGNLNSIDALGWANVHAFDPWAYTGWNTPTPYAFTGPGAWSVALFRPGKAFLYP